MTYEDEPLLANLVRRLWLRRYSFVGLAALILAPLLWLIVQLPDIYTARAQLMIDPRDRTGASLSSLVPALLGDEPAVASEMEVLRSRHLLQEVATELDLVAHPAFEDKVREAEAPLAAVVQALGSSIDVARLNESRVIEVSYEAEDPVLAADIVTALTSQYLDLQTSLTTNTLERVSAWLGTRLETLQQAVTEAEREAEAYRATSRLELGSSPELLERQLEGILERQVQASGALQEASSRHDAFAHAIENGDARTALSLLEEPELAQLMSEVVERERTIRATEMRYGPEHALLREPRQALEAALAQVDAEAAARLEEMALRTDLAERALEALRADARALQADLSKAREREIEQRRLDREAEAAQEVLSQFLRQRSEIGGASLSYTPVWLVSGAVPPLKPSGPIRPVLAVAAAAFAGLAAAALVLMPETARRASRRRLRSLAAQSGIGAIHGLVRAPRSVARQALPSARVAALQKRSAGRYAHAVGGVAGDILSAAPEVGPSPVLWFIGRTRSGQTAALAAGTALAAARGGRKTLLIAPASGRRQTAPGLVAALKGRTDWRADLQRPAGADELAILPIEAEGLVGLTPRGTFEAFLQEAQAAFGLVVLDLDLDTLRRLGLPAPRRTMPVATLPYKGVTGDQVDEVVRAVPGLGEQIEALVLTGAPSRLP